MIGRPPRPPLFPSTPLFRSRREGPQQGGAGGRRRLSLHRSPRRDRKSTRLNSSHGYMPYAGFHLKKQLTHLDRELRTQLPASQPPNPSSTHHPSTRRRRRTA